MDSKDPSMYPQPVNVCFRHPEIGDDELDAMALLKAVMEDMYRLEPLTGIQKMRIANWFQDKYTP